MGDLQEVSSKRVDDLKLSPQVSSILKSIQAEIAEGYREGFLSLTENINTMVSLLNRIQGTLNILAETLAPQIKDKLPVAVQVLPPGQKADLATALVVADPIGMGFTLSQQDLARMLNLNAPEVSVLVNAFGLKTDGECAVTVRRGKSKEIVNFNSKAVEKLLQKLADPPTTLTKQQKQTVDRVRRKRLLLQVPP